ncbi:MAG: inorganic phosphate transporter, partial [Candidatus Aminicenantes bacterium]|nr:inorganic phosphate transporter [Candidatus Aminicenantes bacterium]
MEWSLFILILGLLAGFYSAVNIGANDVANAMATSVASDTLTVKKAVAISATCDFLGAVLVGAHVVNTIRKGLIDPQQFIDRPNHLLFGMLAAVIGSALWVNIATHLKLPVSTTHAIVGGVLGFGLASVGIAGITWKVVLFVVLSWMLSPLFGGVVSFTLFTIIKKSILNSPRPIGQLKKIGPFFVGIVFFILSLATIYEGLENLHLNLPFGRAFIISLGVGGLGFLGSFFFLRNYREKNLDPYYQVEKMAGPLQVLSASFEAFSHGANDVANSIGPVAAVVFIVQTNRVEMNVPVPVWLLLLGGVGIAFGTFVWGHGVMETVGKKITSITPTRGFAAEFGTA